MLCSNICHITILKKNKQNSVLILTNDNNAVSLKASISLACEFLADFHTTFVRVSRECRENFLVSRTSRELVAKFLNMLNNFLGIFLQNISQDCRATFMRVSRTCRREILANLQCESFAALVRMSRECCTTVARRSRDGLAKTSRLSGEKIKLSDIRTNVARHSHECRATVVRI